MLTIKQGYAVVRATMRHYGYNPYDTSADVVGLKVMDRKPIPFTRDRVSEQLVTQWLKDQTA